MNNLSPIHIVDYGLGNLGSIMNMFRRLGTKAYVTSDPKILENADRILLPGVGAFDEGMRNMRERGLIDVLTKKVMHDRVPFLGICLGMQLMAGASEEGQEKGLGWIKGKTLMMRKFSAPERKLKFPHIGWNYIDISRTHDVLKDLPEDPRFYFVHSYMVTCDNNEDVLATSAYGDVAFAAMLARDNMVGAQYHPEKSHRFGMKLLENFSMWKP